MPTKKPVKRATRSSKRTLSSKLRFNKLGVLALAAVLSVAGAVYVFSTYAASGCGSTNGVHQCVWNTPGIHHTGGQAITNHVYWIQSNGQPYFTSKTVWYSNGTASGGHYMWYGPYADIGIASGPGHGIDACWSYYSYVTSVIFDVSEHSGATILGSKTLQTRDSNGLLHEGNHYAELQTYCMSVPMSAGTHTAVELRVKPSTVNGGDMAIYKTAWQVF